MKVVDSIQQMRAGVADARRAGRTVGFVPTMGALHEGHWSLIDQARAGTDYVVVSVFVNPLQFGPSEDFDKYPRTLDADLAGCHSRGASAVFYPAVREVYPEPTLTRVRVEQMSARLCGAFRPGHFEGVATVVCKLLNIVQPDKAYFGEKDFQQLAILRQMVQDLNLPVAIVGCPIVREPDGLAMSSRNVYLSPEERRHAAGICKALQEAVRAVSGGERDAGRICTQVSTRIQAAGARAVDYVAVVDPQTLADLTRIEAAARLCVAAYFGPARLIDNVAVDGRTVGR